MNPVMDGFPNTSESRPIRHSGHTPTHRQQGAQRTPSVHLDTVIEDQTET